MKRSINEAMICSSCYRAAAIDHDPIAQLIKRSCDEAIISSSSIILMKDEAIIMILNVDDEAICLLNM